MRANRFKWTQVGKHFGFNRISIKNRYTKVLSALINKIKNNNNKYCKLNRILYLIWYSSYKFIKNNNPINKVIIKALNIYPDAV